MTAWTLNFLFGVFGLYEPEPVLFEKQVRPILRAYCFECHGEGEKLKGGLDLRLRRYLLAGGDNGAAFHPGKPDTSILIQKVSSGEMPPGKKKLDSQQIQVLKDWISQGAITNQKEPATLPRGAYFAEDELNHWAFKPIFSPRIPAVKSQHLVKTPIDSFLLDKLESKGLSFSPPSEKHLLLRRVYFDLLGLPPSPQEIDAFIQDKAPDAYERKIEELLQSPHYGERWARHWLDVAGYADSEGYDGSDVLRKSAYHFRDYVIRSLNSDKPWDQFIQEQLAGDEMVRPPYDKLPPAEFDKLIGTGFLRLAPDGSSSRDVDLKTSSNQTVADTVQIISGAFFGLTVQCAQCHNHRYDPITQTDYFRLRAVLEPALNPKQWKNIEAREVKIQAPRDKQLSDELEKQALEVDRKRTARFAEVQNEEFDKSLSKVPPGLHTQIKKAFETALAKRSPEQKKLLSDYPNSNVNTGLIIQRNAKLNAEFKKYTDDAAKLRSQKPAILSYRVLTEGTEKPPPTHRHERGDVDQPKEAVLPGHFEIFTKLGLPPIPEDDPTLPTSGRRIALARAITSKSFPLTSRALVNRFWLHHFGKALAGNPSDFGKLGEPPTHPELLDWLAWTFMNNNWKLKDFHRLVLTSNAYRQSSTRSEELQKLDPENRLLGRMNVRRVEGEVLRDAMLKASSHLNTRQFGPPVPVTPDDYGQIVIGADTRDAAGRFTGKKVSLGGEELRRSIYVQVRRSSPLAVFESFDAPMANPACDCRTFSTSSTQSLLMLNSQFVQEQAGYFASHLEGFKSKDNSEKVVYAWESAFGVKPSPEEVAGALRFLSSQREEFRKSGIRNPDTMAWAAFCQGLLISNRFLYVD